MSINVLAFNCSQNENNGNTARILSPLLEGMSKAGANVELFYTNRLNIEICRACTEDSSFVSAGECLIVDDMKYIYPKMRAADIWIFASPNYRSNNNSSLSKLLDRLEPLFDPFHPNLNGSALKIPNRIPGKVLLVSTDNDLDRNAFNDLINTMEQVSLLFGRELIGSILRPHAWTIQATDLFQKKIDDLIKNLNKAGEEIILTGTMSQNTLNLINADIISRHSFIAGLVNN